ncbi:MAG: EFR1 family ferrodoxin [Candidatus Riflebacteria bacterium]|nr:EFR1 family ferrodoxin [Candidatus Riflebacteria bacterium]
MKQTMCIAYFSGTGGTKRIAFQFNDYFLKLGYNVLIHSLDTKYKRNNASELAAKWNEYSCLMLLYSVHEMDAPKPVFEWINELPMGDGRSIAIFSISGGGEVWPNTSSRVNCINELEKKGYNVFYERMMVMPSNVFMYTNDHAAMWLLKILPSKIEKYGKEIVLQKKCRNQIRKKSKAFSTRSNAYERYLLKYSKRFYITDTCCKCKWCIQNCSRENIKETNGKIVFGRDCVLCLRCIYGCPTHAIRNKSTFGLLKNGYNLDRLEMKMNDVDLDPIEKCCKGILWCGIKKYLIDNDA